MQKTSCKCNTGYYNIALAYVENESLNNKVINMIQMSVR